MAERIEIEVHYRECPRCKITMRSPDTIVVGIRYPGDLAEIDQLLRGNLNLVQHTCGEWVFFGEHLTLFYPTLAKIGSTLDLTELFPAEDLAQLEVTRTDGYSELVNVLYGWLWLDAGKVLSPGPEAAELFALSPLEFLEAVRPVALLAMKIHRDGFLPISFAPDMSTPPDRANEVIRELGVDLTVRAVRQVVELVVREGRAEEVFEELAERVPLACLDDVVLEDLSSTTQAGVEDDSAHLMVRWRTSVASAVAYAAAGRHSPEAGDFVAFLFALWNFGRREDVELDARVWVTPDVMHRLVAPESVLELMQALVDAGPESLGSALESFTAFASAMGHDNTVAAALAQFQARMPEPTDAKVDAMVDAILNHAVAHFEQEPEDDPWDRGFVLAGAVWGVISALPQELAVRGHDRARASLSGGSVVVAYAFDCATCQRANRAQRSTLAVHCAELLLAHWGEESIGPEHALFGVNEAANALRLVASYSEALELYRIAEGLDRFVAKDNRRTIRLNRAIVLRDMGDFVVARQLLVELVESDPDDFAAKESLAVLHVRVGEFPASFSLINQTLARPGLPPEVRRRFVRLKGFCCAFSGDAAGAVENLSDELRREPVGSPLRLAALAALQRVDSDEEEIQDALDRAAQEITETAVGAAGSGRSPALTATGSLALRRVRAGDRPAALQAFELCTEILGQEDDWPWQVELVYAWLCVPQDHEEAVEAARRAVVGLDSKVPTAEQAGFAMTWIGDQDVALLQSIATQLAISDPGGRVRVDDLLAAFDLQNGRELTSLAARSRPMPDLGGLASVFHADLGDT